MIKDKCKKIKLLLTDVDGVLTNGKLYFSADGEYMKAFNVKDGQICKYLIDKGIKIGIITGRSSEIVSKRANELNIEIIYQGQKDKVHTLSLVRQKYKIENEQIAYIGDDINDLGVLALSGISACPADAVDKVKKSVDYICDSKGGKGAFREFAEFILYSTHNS